MQTQDLIGCGCLGAAMGVQTMCANTCYRKGNPFGASVVLVTVGGPSQIESCISSEHSFNFQCD